MSRTTASTVGREVYIKTGWQAGQWGIVRAVIGDEIHVSPLGWEEALLFYRDEIRIPRRKREEA